MGVVCIYPCRRIASDCAIYGKLNGEEGRAMIMEFSPIGCVHSSYKNPQDAPRQGRWAEGTVQLEIFEPYEEGLLRIENLKHLIVLYAADRADRHQLQMNPCQSNVLTGVFACRSPHRPNPILFCVAELVERNGRFLTVRGVEALDGSPLLDIKPYVAALDCV